MQWWIYLAALNDEDFQHASRNIWNRRQVHFYNEQECIPVGCVPAAHWLYAGVCFWGVSAPGGGGVGGVSAPRRVSAWGCLLLGGLPGGSLLWGGVVSQHALRQTPPVNRMTDTSKNITLATTSVMKSSIGSSGRVGGPTNMKSMWMPLVAICFMTYLYRAGGPWPPRHPPWIRYWRGCLSQNIYTFCEKIFAGSLESANSSILAACRLFKEVVGKKIRILC